MLYISKLPFYLGLFESEIASKYEIHEKTFDPESLHGRFHILRCLFLAEFVLRAYSEEGVEVDQDMVYLSVIFHDIAREGNGIDEWEDQSAYACFNFMILNSYDEYYAKQTSQLILKNDSLSIEEQVLYDVDVLDYHRFFPSIFFEILFDDSKLKFGSINDVSSFKDNKIRLDLIKYAQRLVIETECFNIEMKTKDLIDHLNEFKNM
jgi:hypothetical protein